MAKDATEVEEPGPPRPLHRLRRRARGPRAAHGAPRREGGRNWPFNLFLLFAGAAPLALHRCDLPRAAEPLEPGGRARDRANAAVEKALVPALDRLRAGDLVNCAEQSRELPGKVCGRPSATPPTRSTCWRSRSSAARSRWPSAANSVNEIASELASGSSEQAASVVEITAAMEELARTASQIAENAATQAELAQRAEESGNAGKVAVEEAVQGVEEVRKRIAGIASRAEILGTRSKEIYRVLDLITEIAQETHILSLNAAIEAAAAGDHGAASRWSPRRCAASPSAPRSRSTRCATCSTSSPARSAPPWWPPRRGPRRRPACWSAPAPRPTPSRRCARPRATAPGWRARSRSPPSSRTPLRTRSCSRSKEVSHVVQRMADGLKRSPTRPTA